MLYFAACLYSVSAPPAFLERATGKGTADFKVNVKIPATTFMTSAIRDNLRGIEEARSTREVQLLKEVFVFNENR